MHDAIVPAAPPESKLNNFILDAVIVPGDTAIDDPPRHDDLPPRRILAVELAPPSGILSGVIAFDIDNDDDVLMALLFLHCLLFVG